MTPVVALIQPLAGIAHLLAHPFLRYAVLAGTATAVASGVVGYFLVLRAQVFTADALTHVAFTGALGALIVGVDLLAGLYVACVVVALALGGLGWRGRADDAVIGSVFAWVLGLGALFLTVYSASSLGSNGTAGVSVLFGTIFGLSGSQAVADAAVAGVVVVAGLAIARPLLFATVDEGVAAARGVPVRGLGLSFLALVGLTAAAATQAVGALLLLGLLAAPAGAAQRLSPRPYRALGLSVALAVGSVWGGLGLAYAYPLVPPSFGILAIATAAYLVALAVTAGPARAPDRRVQVRPGADGVAAGAVARTPPP
ncbi:MAG TPA: metal ABC transporter permease [Acidimicrobiales bacterium]|nr:metal ABC transporter permease [Acidimicrobiales bacterium]